MITKLKSKEIYNFVYLHKNKSFAQNMYMQDCIFYSGSFNPITSGH